MQNNKHHLSHTWDTSDETDRLKKGEDFPKHHHFTRRKGTAEWGFSGVDKRQIKVGIISGFFVTSLSNGEQVKASR